MQRLAAPGFRLAFRLDARLAVAAGRLPGRRVGGGDHADPAALRHGLHRIERRLAAFQHRLGPDEQRAQEAHACPRRPRRKKPTMASRMTAPSSETRSEPMLKSLWLIVPVPKSGARSMPPRKAP